MSYTAEKKFASSVVITEEVKKAIEECNDLAPLHNPANLIGITACEKLMPNTPMTALYSIRRSIRRCRKKHICTDFHTIIMRIIRSDVTASMEQTTFSYLRKRRK